jgi:TetR/AcrR family transcriptional regulator, tetracycline repressor protein
LLDLRHREEKQAVARPKVPLISRRKALDAALEIVDREGLAALSIRRLGEALNVNGASLYHHFKNKDDILVGVTQLALADVTSPRTENDSWRVWLPLNAYRTRQALVAHPELIPVMLRRSGLGIGAKEVEASISRLEEEGVPEEAILPLMESLELLAIVSALQEVGQLSNWAHEDAESAAVTAIKRAERARGLTSEELFDSLCTSVVASIETAVQLKQVRKARTQRSPAARAPRKPTPRKSMPEAS